VRWTKTAAKEEFTLDPLKYAIRTWSRKVAGSEIIKHHTVKEKSRLPSSSACDKANGKKQSRSSVQRTEIRQVARRSRTWEKQEVVDGFERAFNDAGASESEGAPQSLLQLPITMAPNILAYTLTNPKTQKKTNAAFN